MFSSLALEATFSGQTITLTGWHQRQITFLFQVWHSDKYFCQTVKAPGRNSTRQRRMANVVWHFRKSKMTKHKLKLWFSKANRKLSRIVLSLMMLTSMVNRIIFLIDCFPKLELLKAKKKLYKLKQFFIISQLNVNYFINFKLKSSALLSF